MMWISSRFPLLFLCVATVFQWLAPSPAQAAVASCDSLAEVDVVLADAEGNRAVVRYGDGSMAVVSPWQPVCAGAHAVAVRRAGLEVTEVVTSGDGASRRQRVLIEVRDRGDRSRRQVLDPLPTNRSAAVRASVPVDDSKVDATGEAPSGSESTASNSSPAGADR